MSTLVFQMTLKQWDKSQRHHSAVQARQAQAECHPIKAPAKFLIFEHPCILDIHGPRIPKQARLKSGAIQLDRFFIESSPTQDESNTQLILSYQEKGQTKFEIGTIDQHWIQARYQWRYPTEKDNQIFWLYEEVILNAVLLESDSPLDNQVFLQTPPRLSFCPPDETR